MIFHILNELCHRTTQKELQYHVLVAAKLLKILLRFIIFYLPIYLIMLWLYLFKLKQSCNLSYLHIWLPSSLWMLDVGNSNALWVCSWFPKLNKHPFIICKPRFLPKVCTKPLKYIKKIHFFGINHKILIENWFMSKHNLEALDSISFSSSPKKNPIYLPILSRRRHFILEYPTLPPISCKIRSQGKPMRHFSFVTLWREFDLIASMISSS